MDNITRYRSLIRQLLREMARYNADSPSIQTELVFDEERGHYHFGEVGWDGDNRIDSVLVHIDLTGDTIWIQRNWTETRVAKERTRRRRMEHYLFPILRDAGLVPIAFERM